MCLRQLGVKSSVEQLKARNALLAIFTSVRHLARQGVAMRGGSDCDGNLIEILKLRAVDNADLAWWLSRFESDGANRCRHLLSHDIQNEMLSDISQSILRRLLDEIQKSKFYAVMCDGTQDINGQEQVSISIRYVDEDLYPQEVFLGFYETAETTGKAIGSLILDTLCRFGLPLENLRGLSFDGASNMSGAEKGAQSILMEKQPLAYYTHCSAHCVNLVAKAVADIPFIRDAVSTVNELGVLFSRTIKFRNILKHSTVDNGRSPKKLRPLCPTRWTVRHKALQDVVDSYQLVLQSLNDFLESPNVSQEQKAKASGLLHTLKKGETYLSLMVSSKIFSALEKLVKVSSNQKATIIGVLEAMEMTRTSLQIERESLSELLKKCADESEKLDLQELTLPRQRKVPKR